MDRGSGQRQRLEADLTAVEDELERLDRRLMHRPEFGLGKGSARASAWEIALVRRQRAQTRQERLRAAMDRLEAGEYGHCQRCGQPIHPERLEILPATSLCITCAHALTQRATGRPHSIV
jgi:RNA polymerase-binding transcription factor DksA